MTVYTRPSNYPSVHGDLIYTVYDSHVTDSSTYPNYKYVADVYVDSVLVARIKKVQDPTTGVGIFNVGPVVRSYLSTAFNPTAGTLRAQEFGVGEFHSSIVLKFGEEYGFVTYPNLVSDTAVNVYNSYNGRLIGVTSDLAAMADKLASNRPLIAHSPYSSDFLFVPYFPTSTSLISVTVTAYGGGTGLSSSFTPSNAFDLQILNISPGALNTVTPGALTANTTHYTVTIGSQTLTVYIACEPRYEVKTFHFLNKYGGFDTKSFNKVSRNLFDVEKKDFGRLPYTVDGSGNVDYKSGYVYNETRSVYSSQYKEKLIANSDILTDAEYRWLADLVFSPLVYVEEDGYFFPCVVTDSNYEPKKVINDELTNLTISADYGYNLNAQYR